MSGFLQTSVRGFGLRKGLIEKGPTKQGVLLGQRGGETVPEFLGARIVPYAGKGKTVIAVS